MNSQNVLNPWLTLRSVLPLLFRSRRWIRWRGRKDREALPGRESFCVCLLVLGHGGCLCIDGRTQEEDLTDCSVFFPVDNAIILAPQKLAQDLFHGGFLE